MDNVDKLERQLREDGVVVLDNVYTEAQFADILSQYKILYNQFLHDLPNLEWSVNKFVRTNTPTYKLDKRLYDNVPMASWGDDGSAIHLGQGRYDFSSRAKFEQGALGSVWFRYPACVRALVERVLGGDWKDFVGALPSHAQSATGGWHRDIYSLFENEELDIGLPPFYLTMLIPLVELTPENGATEFILGSHRQTIGQAVKQRERYLAAAKPRSIILFDGKIIHRGGPNSTNEDRPVLYQTFTKRWYYDIGADEPNTAERADLAAQARTDSKP